MTARARVRHRPAPVATPQTFEAEAPVDVRISPTATDWTPAAYQQAAAMMPGWHWVRTEPGTGAVAQLVCVHDGRIRPRAAQLRMIVVYDRPHDAPGGFAVREWRVSSAAIAPGKLLGVDLATIEEARRCVPDGLVNIGRLDGDDPKIVEVWL